jgi:hypothetical protein
MLTICLFILFALCLSWAAQTFAPARPPFALAPVVACPTCGGRGWRAAT